MAARLNFLSVGLRISMPVTVPRNTQEPNLARLQFEQQNCIKCIATKAVGSEVQQHVLEHPNRRARLPLFPRHYR